MGDKQIDVGHNTDKEKKCMLVVLYFFLKAYFENLIFPLSDTYKSSWTCGYWNVLLPFVAPPYTANEKRWLPPLVL